MENKEITTEKVEALIQKHKRGEALEDGEKQLLREYRNLEAYRTRTGGVDFVQAQALISPLNDGNFIKEQNRRAVEMNPNKSRNAPFPRITPMVAGGGAGYLGDAPMGWLG